MIGGIFGVLGQAQQQAEAQKQKNLDAQNEMNRVMMMAGYRPNATDPAATQGGAPPQGIADILGQTYGTSDYEFDPSQYAFDPNSPQGQQLALGQGRLEEDIAARQAGNTLAWAGLNDDRKIQEALIGVKNRSLDITKRANEDLHTRGMTKESNDLRLGYANLGVEDKRLKLLKDSDAWKQEVARSGVEVQKMRATSEGYKIITKDGIRVLFDPSKVGTEEGPFSTQEIPVASNIAQTNQIRIMASAQQELAKLEKTDENAEMRMMWATVLDNAEEAYEELTVDDTFDDGGDGSEDVVVDEKYEAQYSEALDPTEEENMTVALKNNKPSQVREDENDDWDFYASHYHPSRGSDGERGGRNFQSREEISRYEKLALKWDSLATNIVDKNKGNFFQ